MGAVELSGAFAHPHHVGRAVEPVAGQGVHPGQALLVGQDKCLVAGPEVHLVQPRFGAQIDATGRHEAQSPVNERAGVAWLRAVTGPKGIWICCISAVSVSIAR